MIVIGDVHGCYKTLVALLEKLPHNNICFTGDLIDRGNNSKEVVELVRSSGYKCVLGNHEEMAIKACLDCDPQQAYLWTSNGGDATIESYKGSKKMHDDVEWFKTLPLYIRYNGYIISHSFLSNAIENVLCSDEDLREITLWGRDFKVRREVDFVNVIGHTPQKSIVIDDSKVIVDTGCVFNRSGYNKLTAFDLDTGEVYEQRNVEWKNNY